MHIECQSCQAKFHISDEKIPKKKIIRVACPKCNNPIEIRHPEIDEDSFLEEGVTEEIGVEEESAQGILASDDVEDSPFEFFDEGQKVALVCINNNERLEKVENALKSLDLHSSLVDSVKMGLSRLRYNQYDVVILDEAFCGEKLEKNTILHYLQPMPMLQRRNIFLVLLSSELRTYDNLAAFILSTNMIVNYRDLNKFKILLHRGLKESERFYKVFNDCLREVGRH